MTKATFFTPEKVLDFSPLVIALPGMVDEQEPTRINEILQDLSKHGIVGMRINYVEKEERGDKRFYRFDMDKVVNELSIIVQRAYSGFSLDLNKVGLISNSISAVPATTYLVRNPNGLKFRCYASISPLLGWQYFGTEQQREFIERKGLDLPITNGESTVKKFVPNDLLPSLKKQNALQEARNYLKNGMAVLTVMGMNDRKSDPQSMMDYHYALGGAEKDLVLLDSDHDVPDSNKHIIPFMKRHLVY